MSLMGTASSTRHGNLSSFMFSGVPCNVSCITRAFPNLLLEVVWDSL